ncbi:hypothetical protein BU23DRAFT_144907 [Bimuria novae-zelandiae CBS 107.79]|uniref:Uncharacterized protein n=1 Tax=Bimuria novae-zelandiae CBS 107.79 TaxID=1447943 RepID=A0A6A5V6X8_9PLEO|nr:hypothetical protein BU23DRAFT_144907 [Bimuria novae-zelandiae CBS 107.79]
MSDNDDLPTTTTTCYFLALGKSIGTVIPSPMAMRTNNLDWQERPGTRSFLDPPETGIHFAPAFGAQFAAGFTSFSLELRIMILKYCLVFGEVTRPYRPHRIHCLRRPMTEDEKWPRVMLDLTVMAHPSIVEPARDVLFRLNTFHVRRNTGDRICLPSPEHRAPIRRLKLSLKPTYSSWIFLRKIARGHMGSTSLKHLQIRLQWDFWCDSADLVQIFRHVSGFSSRYPGVGYCAGEVIRKGCLIFPMEGSVGFEGAPGFTRIEDKVWLREHIGEIITFAGSTQGATQNTLPGGGMWDMCLCSQNG